MTKLTILKSLIGLLLVGVFGLFFVLATQSPRADELPTATQTSDILYDEDIPVTEENTTPEEDTSTPQPESSSSSEPQEESNPDPQPTASSETTNNAIATPTPLPTGSFTPQASASSLSTPTATPTATPASSQPDPEETSSPNSSSDESNLEEDEDCPNDDLGPQPGFFESLWNSIKSLFGIGSVSAQTKAPKCKYSTFYDDAKQDRDKYLSQLFENQQTDRLAEKYGKERVSTEEVCPIDPKLACAATVSEILEIVTDGRIKKTYSLEVLAKELKHYKAKQAYKGPFSGYKDRQEGDIVIDYATENGFDRLIHGKIYVGDNKIVNASTSQKRVIKDDLYDPLQPIVVIRLPDNNNARTRALPNYPGPAQGRKLQCSGSNCIRTDPNSKFCPGCGQRLP